MADSNTYTLDVRTPDGVTQALHLGKNAEFRPLMQTFCRSNNLGLGSVTFWYKGKQIQMNQNPAGVGMRDGDFIVCRNKKSGGKSDSTSHYAKYGGGKGGGKYSSSSKPNEPRKDLMTAANEGVTEDVRHHLDNGEDPDTQSKKGKAPLSFAAAFGHMNTVELLLKYGADPNLVDFEGTGALHSACRWGHTVCVKILLEYGANPRLVDGDGNSPYDLANAYGHIKVTDVLEDFERRQRNGTVTIRPVRRSAKRKALANAAKAEAVVAAQQQERAAKAAAAAAEGKSPGSGGGGGGGVSGGSGSGQAFGASVNGGDETWGAPINSGGAVGGGGSGGAGAGGSTMANGTGANTNGLVSATSMNGGSTASMNGGAGAGGASAGAGGVGGAGDDECSVHFPSAPRISFDDVLRATENLDAKYILHKSSEVVVYAGHWQGSPVAVKCVRIVGLPHELEHEVVRLGGSKHDRVLPVIGVAYSASTLFIMYPLSENRTLANRLACQNGTAPLDWATRLNVMLGIVDGLNYLHTTNMVPVGDLKTTNVCLNERMEPQLSLLTSTSAVCIDPFAGSVGYLDPHVTRTGYVSLESDVYSFGVVALELLTGTPAILKGRYPIDLASWTEMQIANGRSPSDLCDRTVNTTLPANVADAVVRLSLECIEPRAHLRRPLSTIRDQLVSLLDQIGGFDNLTTIGGAECVMCGKLADTILLPCGHQCLCNEHVEALQSCPLPSCREPINQTQPAAYL